MNVALASQSLGPGFRAWESWCRSEERRALVAGVSAVGQIKAASLDPEGGFQVLTA